MPSLVFGHQHLLIYRLHENNCESVWHGAQESHPLLLHIHLILHQVCLLSCLLCYSFFFFFSVSILLPLLFNSFPLLYSAGELDERTSASLWEVLLSNTTDSSPLLRKWIQLKADRHRWHRYSISESAGALLNQRILLFFCAEFQRFHKCGEAKRDPATMMIHFQAFTNFW